MSVPVGGRGSSPGCARRSAGLGGACRSLHHPPIPQVNDALAVSRIRLRVRHLHDRRPAAVQLREQLHDLLPLARVEIAGRLVGEDQGRRVDQCARHGHELLLAARELPWEEIFLRDDSESVQRVGNQRVALALLDVAVRQRDIEVLGDRKVVEQVVLLKHEPDVLLVERHAVLGLHLVHQVVQEAVLAGPVAVEHAEHREQCGLPRPGWAHDGDELASGDVERDLPQDEQAAVALGDGLVEVLELDHSYLNATMGSTRAARRAGNQPASRATALNNAIATTYATESVGATPNSSPRSTRVSTSAAMKPSANPIMAKRSEPPTTNRCTAAGSAPSAMRTPISLVRRATT